MQTFSGQHLSYSACQTNDTKSRILTYKFQLIGSFTLRTTELQHQSYHLLILIPCLLPSISSVCSFYSVIAATTLSPKFPVHSPFIPFCQQTTSPDQCDFWILSFCVPVPKVQCIIEEKKNHSWTDGFPYKFTNIGLNTARELLHPQQSDSPLTFHQNCLTIISDVFYFTKSRRNFSFLSLWRSLYHLQNGHFLLLKTLCSFSCWNLQTLSFLFRGCLL